MLRLRHVPYGICKIYVAIVSQINLYIFKGLPATHQPGGAKFLFGFCHASPLKVTMKKSYDNIAIPYPQQLRVWTYARFSSDRTRGYPARGL
jgi:hypothetical protein